MTEAAPAVSRARNSDECRSEKKPMLSLISLANSRRWLLARMALPICDRITGVAVGRGTLEGEDHDGDQRQQRDAAHVLVDIGLVDDLAEQIGRARGRRRRHRHQHERQQIAPPVGEALFGDQAANQRRGARGIVGDFAWEVRSSAFH